mmetsp:Transcript_2089/g.7072  ORF Transcript_2089/g.7072 Transcript_2089/m.7072 type:complete len:235 (-) Transcript_2089:560-1264(-)
MLKPPVVLCSLLSCSQPAAGSGIAPAFVDLPANLSRLSRLLLPLRTARGMFLSRRTKTLACSVSLPSMRCGRRATGRATMGLLSSSFGRRRMLSSSMAQGEVRLAIFSHQSYMNACQVAPIREAFPETKAVPVRLTPETAALAADCNAVCAFVNDDLGAATIDALADLGVGCVAMRCAGFDRVDLPRADARGVVVLRVPAYSPYAVAEHSVALLLGLNRQLIKSAERVLLSVAG